MENPGSIPRIPGESFASFDARQRAHRAANTPAKPKRKRAAKKPAQTESYDSRSDNLGESPDY